MKLAAYPGIVIISWFLICIIETMTALGHVHSIHLKVAEPVAIALSCLQGFFTTVFFFYTNKVKVDTVLVQY